MSGKMALEKYPLNLWNKGLIILFTFQQTMYLEKQYSDVH